jgi:hypothetical protein
MTAPNEFWICLHRVSVAYAAEGATPDERLANIMSQFRQMPAIARRELLADFALIARNLPDLYAASVTVHNEADPHGEDRRARREDVA